MNTVVENNIFKNLSEKQEFLLTKMRATSKKIAPVWPLENFVAVNPYLGITDKKFNKAAQYLKSVGNIDMTLPTSFYLQKFEEGKIDLNILDKILNKKEIKTSATEFIKKIKNSNKNSNNINLIPTVSDLAKEYTGKDWERFIISRISAWASAYFDKNQAYWSSSNKKESIFESWKKEAEIDRTPEITGLKNFRNIIKSISTNPIKAAEDSLKQLNITDDKIDLYLHKILLKVGGWAAYASYLDWESELNGNNDGKLIEFLSIVICWESSLYEAIKEDEFYEKWNEKINKLNLLDINNYENKDIEECLILQESFDLTEQQNIVNKFNLNNKITPKLKKQAKAQAIFCIDVRSEVYRRNLELADNEIETIGFAGFFGLPINYVPLGHNEGEAQCPVLLKTGPTVMEKIENKDEEQKAIQGRILNKQIGQVWKSFKSGAITCFSFVSPIGLSYLPKLFTDSFGLTRPVEHPDEAGMKKDFSKKKDINLETKIINNETVGISISDQIQMAKNILKAMSLQNDFGKFVLIVGHGSTTVNNPHATGYDCGACGGHTGEANARVAAKILNNKEVKNALRKENISIPEDTIFLACLHDTTTDEVNIFNEQDVPLHKKEELDDVKKSLTKASTSARKERSLKLKTDSKANLHKSIITRSKDWSQIRPEWGLAGCSSFIVASRERTKNLDFDGKSFLHSYNWKQDQGFSILELIMTAPMIVTSWINLQYYGSTVDNKNFGSGNKTLHNITSGIGVLEGFSGDLRVGLPLQSIHDGERFQHEPLRLNVVIEAPIEAINIIISKHPPVKELLDNRWIHLLAMDENGDISHRYDENLNWEKTTKMIA